MGQVIMIYDAKCKHCLHMKYRRLTKTDGSESKVMRGYCDNQNSPLYKQDLTLKSKACDKLEL